MLNIAELGNWLEEIDILFLVVFATIEVGIDLICHNQRNYHDTIANVAISLIYGLTNAVFGYAIADFLYYWEHRAEHQIRFFWAYHNVHHSSTDYNLTVASRLSWVETCCLWVFYIPMALLGFDPLQILIAVQISAAYQTWIHTQKIGHLGILEKVLNTPASHRVHHASNPRYIDKNFGGIVMIWDRLFGTYQPETETPIYGLTKNINTYNPIQINAIEYQRIGRYIIKSKSIKEMWKSVFGSLE